MMSAQHEEQHDGHLELQLAEIGDLILGLGREHVGHGGAAGQIQDASPRLDGVKDE